FADEISGAAEWVSRNRGPLMEFFLAVINGAFEMGRGFVNFAATAMESIADVLDSMAGFESFLDPIGPVWKKLFGDSTSGGMRDAADQLRESAGSMRTDFSAALDDMQDCANAWAAPEIMKAHHHDAM